MSPERVTAAVVQAEVAPDLDTALERTAQGVREARAAGASLVVFPETWIPGYPAWLDLCRDAALWDHAPTKAVFARMARDSVAVPGPTLDALGAMARASRTPSAVRASAEARSGATSAWTTAAVMRAALIARSAATPRPGGRRP